MPPKKVTPKQQEKKKDVMDLLKDATSPGKKDTLGQNFLRELGKKNAKAEELHHLLVGWGYKGISLEESRKLLRFYKTRPEIRNFCQHMAY